MPADVVVLTGGDPASPQLADRVDQDAFVIAADSGLLNASALGLVADLVVGDFDSLDDASLRAAEHAGAAIERHPEAKDRTDIAIALDAALAHLAEQPPLARRAQVTVVGGHGGRLDHLLANALLLAADAYRDLDVVAHMGPATVTVIHDHAVLTGVRGELVTLLPPHGPAHGVTTEGLLYPLHGESLSPGSTRGVSNEFVDAHARVALESGVLLAIQPGSLGTHVRSRPTEEDQ